MRPNCTAPKLHYIRYGPDGAEDFSLGGKARQISEELSALLSERTAKTDFLEAELSRLQARILDLEASVESSMTDLSSDFSSACCSSTPKQSCSSSCCLINIKLDGRPLGGVF